MLSPTRRKKFGGTRSCEFAYRGFGRQLKKINRGYFQFTGGLFRSTQLGVDSFRSKSGGRVQDDRRAESIVRISRNPWRMCFSSEVERAGNGSGDCFLSPLISALRCWRAPAMVKPSS